MKTYLTAKGNKITQVLTGKSKAFLLSNGQKNILIDTATPSKWNALNKKLNSLGLKKIDLLVLTHSHFDHAGNASRIKENYNAEVLIHRTEVAYLEKGESIPPVGANSFARLLVRFLSILPASFSKYEPCKSDYMIDDNFNLSDFGFNSYLIHTPGHTPGSISLIVDDEIALTGDAMFGFRGLTISPPFASDKNQLKSSWYKLLNTNAKLFIPSHGLSLDRSFVERYLKKKE